MNSPTRFLRRSAFLVLALAVAACTGDSTGPETGDGVFLRITNERATTISVRVVGSDQIAASDRLTVEFGSVPAGTTTAFREVNESFSVFIDGELYQNGSNNLFGIDDTPTNQWTLTMQASGGWGLEAYFGS